MLVILDIPRSFIGAAPRRSAAAYYFVSLGCASPTGGRIGVPGGPCRPGAGLLGCGCAAAARAAVRLCPDRHGAVQLSSARCCLNALSLELITSHARACRVWARLARFLRDKYTQADECSVKAESTLT